MSVFKFKFEGREIGAIGMPLILEATRIAETQDAARLLLYDKFEHIHIIKVERI